MENMMVEGVGVDGKGCTNLKGNLRTKLSEIEEPRGKLKSGKPWFEPKERTAAKATSF